MSTSQRHPRHTMHFHHATLKNGLEIIAELNPAVQSVAFGFFARTGSRDESPDVHGVSHFLEHMVFKGTDRFSAADVNRILDEVGADSNAETGEEYTAFYAAVLPEYLPVAFEVHAAILQPALRDEDFHTEKQVILEEIGMYDDQPSIVAYDRAMQAHFRGHPLERTILGTTDSIARLTAADMRRYHRDHYRAGNIVLAVAGNVGWDEVRSLAEAHCARWPSGKSVRPICEAKPTKGCEIITRESLQMQQALQLAPAPAARDPLHFAAELLTVVVGDDQNSRLYWELVDPGHAELAELSYHHFEETGAFLFFLNGAPDDLDANLDRANQVFATINRQGITDQELRQAKTKVASRIVLRGERPMGRLSSLGGNWVSRQEYRAIADDLRTVEALALDDFRRLLEAYPLSPITTVAVGPCRDLQLP